MKKAFSKVLQDYKRDNSLTNIQMAEVLGISIRMYNYYEKGEYDGNAVKVKKYMEKLERKYEPVRDTPSVVNEGTPVFDLKATAGDLVNTNQGPEVPSFHVSVPGYEDCNFGMYVYGHSMYPTIENGSLILCRKVNDKSVILFGEIYLIRTKDYLMVKRLQKSTKAGCLLCTSDNFEKRSEEFRRFEPFDIAQDKIIDLYLVKGIIKKNQS